MKVGDIVYSATTSAKLKIVALYEDEGQELAVVRSFDGSEVPIIYPVSRLTSTICPSLKDNTKTRDFISGLEKLVGREIKDLSIRWTHPNQRPVTIYLEISISEVATKSLEVY